MYINCELPIKMLGWNLALNQYDFILYHLLEYPEYKEYYKSIRHHNRWTVMDNSGFEYAMKGQKLDWEAFIDSIEEMEPHAYFIPDILGDFDKTQDMFFEWDNFYKKQTRSRGIPIAQGSTEKEIISALNTYKMCGYNIVALPFHLSCFQLDDTVKSRARGRAEFCNRNQRVLHQFEHVHLLGSHDWREPAMHQCHIIKTIDTSYPVKCAIAQVDMDGPKPDILIDSFIDSEFEESVVGSIIENVQKFKRNAG